MSNLLLAKWIEKQFKARKKAYKIETDEKKRAKILYSLAKLLRQYINNLKTKTGLGQEQKQEAYRMTAWLQSEILKGDWSSDLSYCFDSILYAGKHAGNVADEGRALRSALNKSEREQLDILTKRAQQRFERGLGDLDSKISDRAHELRDLALLSDPPEVDQAGDPGGLSDDRNGDS